MRNLAKRHDDWIEFPNLWGAVIGAPGVMKSHAIEQPHTFLEDLEKEANQNYENGASTYAAERAAYEAKQKALENKMKEVAKEEAKNDDAARDDTKHDGNLSIEDLKAQYASLSVPKAPVLKRYKVTMLVSRSCTKS